MKYVALLSGGKDSCLNIMKCQGMGHTLVCLANLQPEDENTDEINSFMYQSAAHNIISLQSQCFNVPLVRKTITKKAFNQTLRYSRNEADEVEDLYELLQEILIIYPDIQGVSCGAILSNYQRYRVENVCHRLSLTPLMYLWQIPRQQIFDEIIHNNIEAIIVKVAGAGLDPNKHLGKSLRSLQSTLNSLHNRYGLDICGEGGEYESLVLDMPLYRSFKLRIDEKQSVVDHEDPSVGNLRIIAFGLEEKQPLNSNDSSVYPKLFVNYFDDEINKLMQRNPNLFTHEEIIEPFTYPRKSKSKSTISESTMKLHIGYDGLIQSELIVSKLGRDSAPTEQLNEILSNISSLLQRIHCQLRDIVFVHLYLRSINDFQEINKEYLSWFGENPPSRSCIQVVLSEEYKVGIEFIALGKSYDMIDSNREIREVLHVQSMSNWAPLCIGPYSQANSVMDSIIFVAGQIPLNPSTMIIWEPLESDKDDRFGLLIKQLILCIRHVSNIVHVMRSSLEEGIMMILYINRSVLGDSESADYGFIDRIIQDVVSSEIYSYTEQTARSFYFDRSVHSLYPEYDLDEKNDDHQNQDVSQRNHDNLPVSIVVVPDLPRKALVEVEFIGSRLQSEVHSMSDQHRIHSVDCDNISQNQINTVKGDDNDLVNVYGWPVWTGNEFIQEYSKIVHSDDDSLIAKSFHYPQQSETFNGRCHSSVRYYEKCFCSGYIDVCITSEYLTSLNSEIIDSVGDSLFLRLQLIFEQSKLSLRHVLFIRLYYPHWAIDQIDIENLRYRFNLHLCSVCDNRDQSMSYCIIPVPVEALRNTSTLISLVFVAIDGIAIRTEKWILKGS